jgi:hypothetical protein
MTCLDESAGAARRELAATAVHEAGHVVFALAVGINVLSATIEPTGSTLGGVTYEPLPVPTQVMCQPGSMWIDILVKNFLAGDRAARVNAPIEETATGGPSSDYAQANKYLDAVYPSADVETQLDRLCFELDEFFRLPQIAGSVKAVSELLLSDLTVDGKTLRRLVNGGSEKCGSFSPDYAIRCTVDPHHFYASHISKAPGSKPGFWHPLGYVEVDRTPHSRRSPEWKRVIRLYSPGLLPAPPRKLSYADLPELKAIANDSRRTQEERMAANRRVARLLAMRIRKASVAHSLPRPSDAAGEGSDQVLDRHQDECGEKLHETDTDYWCESCGLEFVIDSSKKRRRRWVYLILEYRRVRQIATDGIEGEPEWLTIPGLSFPTADHARNYLRLIRTTEAAGPRMTVRRIARR